MAFASPFSTPRGKKPFKRPHKTPECFASVHFETPTSTGKCLKRSSSERCEDASNLTVAVRVRGMNNRELAHIGATSVVNVEDKTVVHVKSCSGGNSTDHIFKYDHVFGNEDENQGSQKYVFDVLGEPLLEATFAGYNACLFAYGQTGSGKTFSMMGKSDVEIDSEPYSGIIPRFARRLFEEVARIPDDSCALLELNYYEIYNEKIHDLLVDYSTTNRMALKVREHPYTGPYVENLSVHSIKTYEEFKKLLLMGNKNRATAATNLNEKSSRSHSILSFELNMTDDLSEDSTGIGRRSKVSLIDLAGSERLSSSHNTEEKIKQGVSINKSLLTLGKVISSLADQKKKQFVPYRDSILTWLLKESLGGNSMTTMLATVTPANVHVDETLATLRYACQARSIVNRARVNENPHEKLIRELRSEVLRLRSLKRNFENFSCDSSILQTSTNSTVDNSIELDELRQKLSDTESKLREAQESWETKFRENRDAQIKQLSEIERRKEELESRVRIMENSDDIQTELTPYQTNFLQELEVILERNSEPTTTAKSFEKIVNWCDENFLFYSTSRNSLLLIDYRNNKQTIVTSSDMESVNKYRDVGEFLNNLTWNVRKPMTKLKKRDVQKSINEIYRHFSELAPSPEDEHLNLLYAKIGRSLQKYESAILNSIVDGSPKNVSFKL